MAEKDKITSITPLHYKYPAIATEDIPQVEEAILDDKRLWGQVFTHFEKQEGRHPQKVGR
jgi:hypothetical protein